MRSRLSASVCVSLFLLSGCGGGGGGGSNNAAVSSSPPSGSALFTSDPIVFTFERAMNPSSLTLSGSMAADSDGGTWSTTTSNNNTLTLNGDPAWNASQPGTLTVSANDTDGDLVSITASYGISLKLTHFQPAVTVIGQPDFVSVAVHQGGAPGANTMDNVFGMVHAGGRLYLSDYASHRILGFDAIPESSNASASFVIGQPDFSTANSGSGAEQLGGPEGLASDGTRLVVADWDNRRVTIFDPLPTAGPATASVVLGQPDFSPPVAPTVCTDSAIDELESVTVAGGKVIASVYAQNRILIWNSVPTTNGAPANLVLGQNSFTTCIENDDDQDGTPDGPSNRTLNTPEGIWSDGERLIVADSGNQRVLIWNTFPTTNFAPADVVIGQSNFTLSARNDTNQDGSEDANPNAQTVWFPLFVHSNGTQLVVSDNGNNRVLVWNEIPTTNFAPANVVLGQSDFTKRTADDGNQDGLAGPVSANTNNSPGAVLIAKDKLLLSEHANHRVLIYTGQ